MRTYSGAHPQYIIKETDYMTEFKLEDAAVITLPNGQTMTVNPVNNKSEKETE